MNQPKQERGFWLRVYSGRIPGPVLLKLVAHNNVILGMTHACTGIPTNRLQPTEEQCQNTGRVRRKVQHREATLYLEQHQPPEASGYPLPPSLKGLTGTCCGNKGAERGLQ